MLVLAVGNRLRSDDGVAFDVAEHIRREAPGRIEIVHSDDVLSLIDEWTGEDVVVLIDAVLSGAAPGTLHELDATAGPLPQTWGFASSHQIGLANVVEIARELDRLPAKLIVIGVEADNFEYGVGLSPAVGAVVPMAAALALAYLPCRVV